MRRLVLDGLVEHWSDLDVSRNTDLDDIATSYRSGRTIVAVLEGVVVGTGTVVPHGDAQAQILRMSIDRAARRRGVGRAVLHELEATARAWSVTDVILETTSEWADVIDFYLACGYTITGELGEDTWFRKLI